MKSLRRMLRDSKNKDYLDQIYFALGDLEERMGNTDEALKLWALSAASSTVNNRQRARSYLALAEYYYNQPEYMTAWHYYDSASYLLDDRYPDYEVIRRRASDLGEYAQYQFRDNGGNPECRPMTTLGLEYNAIHQMANHTRQYYHECIHHPLYEGESHHVAVRHMADLMCEYCFGLIPAHGLQ